MPTPSWGRKPAAARPATPIRRSASGRFIRRAALGDTEQPVVIVQNKKSLKEVGAGLFENKASDSVLKKVVVWGAAAYGLYFGSKLLAGTIGKDIAAQREVTAQKEIIQQAALGTNPAAAAATALAKAIYPGWDENKPKEQPYTWFTTSPDEVTIFNILAGPTEKTFGILRVARYAPKINSLQSWLACAEAYKTLTGRGLEDDLRTKIGSWDWDFLKPYIARTRCISRKVDPKTKKVTLVKVC